MMITKDNIEAWLLRYAEDELNAEEVAEVEACLQQHPEWAELLAEYDPDFRLPAAEGVQCPVKEQLMHRQKIAFLPWWKYASVAAVFLLLMAASIVFFRPVPQSPEPGFILAQHPKPVMPVAEDTSTVASMAVRSSLPSAEAKPVLTAALPADTLPSVTDAPLLVCSESSDEGAFSETEVDWVLQPRNESSETARVTYTIYTDQLLDMEEETAAEAQPQLKRYVYGKVSDFILKKIKDN